LRRGARLTEILKQKQYQPVPVEKQIALIWTATEGYLDELPVESLERFQQEYFDYLEIHQNELLKNIIKEKVLTDEIKAGLKEAADSFTEEFKKSL
jgi:F-type H+-transporting ATPase subunit alpha